MDELIESYRKAGVSANHRADKAEARVAVLEAQLFRLEANLTPKPMDSAPQCVRISGLIDIYFDEDGLRTILNVAPRGWLPIDQHVQSGGLEPIDWDEMAKGDYSLPCPHPSRNGHHETYCNADGAEYCRACGRWSTQPAREETKEP